MRFFVCLILFSALTVLRAQDAPNTPINERFSKAPLSKVIRVLKNKYKIKVAYDDALVTGIVITGSYQDISIRTFLDQVLPEHGIDYQILNGKIILTPRQVDINLDKPSLFDLTVYGVVIDSKTGETLPNALVRVEGSSLGTITNSDGYFSLPKVPNDTSTIVISYLGYKKNDIRLIPGNTRQTLRIMMDESVKNLASFTLNSDREGDKIKYGDDIGQIKINPNVLSGLPSLGELDVFRSLQLLPGISGSSENASGLNIRSSPSAHNLVLFDGFPIYRLDHFFGVFSAINSDAVRDIQVYKGGYKARYGGRISGVVDITGKTGNFNQPTYNFGINLLSARFSMNAPLNSGKGAVHISFRRAYTDIIRNKLFEKLYELYGNSQSGTEELALTDALRPDFRFQDLHVKTTYNVSKRDIVSFSLYRGRDILNVGADYRDEDGTDNFTYSFEENTDWGNSAIGAIWSRNWSSNYYSSLQASRSVYFFNSNFFEEFRTNSNPIRTVDEDRSNEIRDVQLNFKNEISIGNKHELDIGFNASNLLNTQTVLNEAALTPISAFREQGTILALYASDKFRFSKKFEINAGFRYEVTDITADNYIGHRVSLSYRPVPVFELKAASGRFYQLVNDIVWDDPRNRNQNFWFLARDEEDDIPDAPADFMVPSLQSDHWIAGFNYSKNGFLIDVEFYEKRVDGLLDISLSYASLLGNNTDNRATEQYSSGSGLIRGVDFLVQKNAGPYQGWFAYTLSKASNRFDNINNGERIRARQDQRHELKFINSLSLPNWNISASWIYGSGKPYYVPRVRFIRDNGGVVRDYDLINTDKVVNNLPSYQRLDFSIAYKFSNETSSGEIGISLFNVLNRKNIQSRELDLSRIDASIAIERNPQIAFRDLRLLDFTPSVFLNLKF